MAGIHARVRIRTDDNGLLGALESVDLMSNFGNPWAASLPSYRRAASRAHAPLQPRP
jgi:hypothetical protein